VSEIFLLRHGQASFGAEDYDRLSQLGERQVRLLGEHLAALGIGFDAVYSGSMRRQRDSARIVLQAMGVDEPPAIQAMAQFDEFAHLPILREYLGMRARAGDEEVDIGRLRSDRRYFQQVFDAATRRWIGRDLVAPDIEDWEAFCGRVSEGIAAIRQRHVGGQRVLVSTSAGAISVAVQAILGMPRDQALKLAWVVGNSSLTRVLYHGDRISLAAFNSLTHLEQPDRVALISFR